MFWLFQNSARTAPRLSLFPTLSSPSPTVSRLGMGKKLDWDTTRTADPDWPGIYSVLYDKALSNKN